MHNIKLNCFCIYNIVRLYVYCCQDIVIKSNDFNTIKAGDFYRLDIGVDEMIYMYPTNTSGVIAIDYNILQKCNHNQIIFHKINDSAMLCEIKPFVVNEGVREYVVNGGNLKIVSNSDLTYIYFNGIYYGCINQSNLMYEFEKFNKNDTEYGLLKILGETKHIILFTSKIIYCGAYIDNEKLKDGINIYTHVPNIFNAGKLIKYSLANKELTNITVKDRGEENIQINNEFNIIYFLEAIKCGRYKYAYNKLSYELRSEINMEVLSKYFHPFDSYKYLPDENIYITLNNKKIAGLYNFKTQNNMIDNIF